MMRHRPESGRIRRLKKLYFLGNLTRRLRLTERGECTRRRAPSMLKRQPQSSATARAGPHGAHRFRRADVAALRIFDS